MKVGPCDELFDACMMVDEAGVTMWARPDAPMPAEAVKKKYNILDL